MKLSILRRSAVLAAVPAAVLVASVVPAEAAAAGVVLTKASGPSGSADGECAYTATLPDVEDFNSISVAFSGTAQATPSVVGVVPVSTSIRCYLRNQASGDAGITLPGAAAAIAGKGEVHRLAPDPEICATVSAAFSDGTVALPKTTCINL